MVNLNELITIKYNFLSLNAPLQCKANLTSKRGYMEGIGGGKWAGADGTLQLWMGNYEILSESQHRSQDNGYAHCIVE